MSEILLLFFWLLIITQALPAAETEKSVVDADGTVHIPAFAVPPSKYMSEEAKRQLIAEANSPSLDRAVRNRTGGNPNAPIAQLRQGVDDFYRPMVERAKLLYPVNIEDRSIGGVQTQIVTPKAGIGIRNHERVLINLHGGGFIVGAGLGGLAESIPVAGMGKFRVITVDYREAPENRFPAASEDVASVYSELLKQYHAKNIGIYGCSAGGVLTAEATAWFQKRNLPSPGAIGIFSAGGFSNFSGPPLDPNSWGGDSRFTGPPLVGASPPPLNASPPGAVSVELNYTGNTDPSDAWASPALSQALLVKFPPTLLLSGTRAYDMSAAVQTQRELTKAGVDARLHLWDGMGHCFFLQVDLPEAKEAYAVITNFFDLHLGR